MRRREVRARPPYLVARTVNVDDVAASASYDVEDGSIPYRTLLEEVGHLLDAGESENQRLCGSVGDSDPVIVRLPDDV